MHLHRVTPDPFENYSYKPGGRFLSEASTEYKVGELHFDEQPAFEIVTTAFPRFGGGERRHSDFEVHVDWSDVEKIIEKFCEAKHPEAISLQEARKLAEAVKGAGWRRQRIF
jgi:hypothetical protein